MDAGRTLMGIVSLPFQDNLIDDGFDLKLGASRERPTGQWLGFEQNISLPRRLGDDYTAPSLAFFKHSVMALAT